MRLAIAVLIAGLPFAGSFAQGNEMTKKPMLSEGHHMEASSKGVVMDAPDGWMARLDKPDPSAKIGRPDDADVFFVDDTPGWHITTHASGIYFRPNNEAEGLFTAQLSLYLLGKDTRDREGFGMFVGGSDLDGATEKYTYFLLRNTGDFLIKRRTGSSTSVVKDWTHTDAMNIQKHDSTGAVLNELTIKAGEKNVSFLVNGTQVADIPRDKVDVDGIVGMRLNHGLDVHVLGLSLDK